MLHLEWLAYTMFSSFNYFLLKVKQTLDILYSVGIPIDVKWVYSYSFFWWLFWSPYLVVKTNRNILLGCGSIMHCLQKDSKKWAGIAASTRSRQW